MKKIVMAICLAFLSVGAFANSATTVETTNSNKMKDTIVAKRIAADYVFTISCGEVWDVHVTPGAPLSVHAALWQLMEDACGTDIDYVEIP